MKIYHVYAMNACDGEIGHYLVKAKSDDDARELFEATEDNQDTNFIVLEKPIKKIQDHKHIICAKDIGE